MDQRMSDIIDDICSRIHATEALFLAQNPSIHLDGSYPINLCYRDGGFNLTMRPVQGSAHDKMAHEPFRRRVMETLSPLQHIFPLLGKRVIKNGYHDEEVNYFELHLFFNDKLMNAVNFSPYTLSALGYSQGKEDQTKNNTHRTKISRDYGNVVDIFRRDLTTLMNYDPLVKPYKICYVKDFKGNHNVLDGGFLGQFVSLNHEGKRASYIKYFD